MKRLPTTPAGLVTKTVSFSGLTNYDKCSKLYELARVTMEVDAYVDTEATRMGSFCHEALERHYETDEGLLRTPFDHLQDLWAEELAKYGLSGLQSRMQELAHHTTALYQRARADYKGADAIRKGDGSVPKAAHMTGPWTAYAREHGLGKMEADINGWARKNAPDRWGQPNMSLSKVYTESLGIMWPYTHPEAIASVVDGGIEFKISDVRYVVDDGHGNPLEDGQGGWVLDSKRGKNKLWKNAAGKTVPMEVLNPWYLPKLGPDGKLMRDADGDLVFRDDILWNGYIDMLARDVRERLLVIDHKTNGGDPPAPAKVGRHEQMGVYGFIIKDMSGEEPHELAMNHLRSNRLVRARYSQAAADKAMERMLTIVDAIDKNVFVPQHPDAYETQCIKKGFRDNDPPVLCPGLRLCHPEVYEFMTSALAA